MKKSKGSMTVEAVIVLPVFLMFFLFMMYIVNVCSCYLALNQATDQVCSSTANKAYVYYFVANKLKTDAPELEDLISEGTVKDVAYNTLKDSLIESIKGGAIKLDKSAIREYAQDLKGSIFNLVLGHGLDEIEEHILVNEAEKELKMMIEGTRLEGEEVVLTLYKMPGFTQIGTGAAGYEIEDSSSGDADVIIQAEYKMSFDLLVYGEVEIPIVCTAVEKAWLNGSDGTYIKDDKSFLEK